jgi:serine/threonine protein kinase
MSPEATDPTQERFASLLAACDEVLAAGAATPPAQGPACPPELQPRLGRALECLQRLQRLRPASGAGLSTADTELESGPAAGPPAVGPLTRLGRFELRHKLGQGGFGVVYLAYDPKLGREVALKLQRPEALATAELRERFQREARAAAALDHPNVVPVYEAGEVGPVCYIASAYCPGPTLAAWLKGRAEPVPFWLAAELAATLADAVQHAHDHGVLHRDLKPANVLLSAESKSAEGKVLSTESKDRTDASLPSTQHSELGTQDSTPAAPQSAPSTQHSALRSCVPKITDFGLAKQLADGPGGAGPESLTQTGAVLGTPSYMAPEQAGGKAKEVGPAADVYALGAILYEMLTGRPPFQAESSLDLLEMVRSADPVPPSRLRGKLPRDLETICLHCLHKEPLRRYGRAGALADDLRAFLAGKPIQARPSTAWQRAVKWARRRPAAAALLAVSALAAAALLGGGLWYQARLQAALADAAQQRDQVARARDEVKRQLGEVERQREEARKQQRHAEDRFELARDAVDRFHAQVSGSPELRSRGAEPLRTRLLEMALEYYQKLLREKGDKAILGAERVRAHRKLGELYWDTRRTGPAEQSYREAIALARRLAADRPGEPRFLDELARALNQLGNLYQATSRPDRAEPTLREAQALWQRLAEAHPGNANFRDNLAGTQHNLGNVYLSWGRPDQAEQTYREARALWRRLAEARPDDPEVRSSLVVANNRLAVLLAERGQTEPAEQALAEALADGRRLADAFPKEPTFQEHLGKTHQLLGALYFDTARPGPARTAFQEALAVWGRLARTHPQVPRYQQELAKCHYNLGVLDRGTGREEQAFQEALAIRQRLAEASPLDPQYQKDLANSLQKRGSLCRDAGRDGEAEQAFQQAQAIHRRLADGYPDMPEYRHRLAVCCNDLGLLYQDMGRVGPAETTLREGLTAWKSLVRSHPRVLDYATGLGGTCCNLANLRQGAGRPGEALPLYGEAVGALEGVVRQQPRNPKARAFLLNSYRGRAAALRKLGRHAEEVKDWGRAAAFAAGPGRTVLRLGRAEALALLGDHARAAAAAGEISDDKSLTGRHQALLAGVWSLSSAAALRDDALPQAERDRLARAYADRALDVLGSAVRSGFRDAKHLQCDRAYEPLRERAEFRALVDALGRQGPAKP